MSSTSSIDSSEMEHFSRLARLWWDESGPFWPLHRMNALRVDFIHEQMIQNGLTRPGPTGVLSGVRVLDIGCGGGILSEAVARLGARVHGVDMVERNIRIAQDHARAADLDIRYECGTAEMLSERGESYDVVLSMEVVEHVADLPFFMTSCMNLVRPGGLLVVATINRTLASWLGAIVFAEHILRWLPKGTHHWRKFPKPAELEAMLAAGGMDVITRTGVGMNPLPWRFRLTRYMGINYILVARKPQAER